jgi:hypothetical protein
MNSNRLEQEGPLRALVDFKGFQDLKASMINLIKREHRDKGKVKQDLEIYLKSLRRYLEELVEEQEEEAVEGQKHRKKNM